MPDFPRAEYEARTENAQRLMREAGLDALWFTTEAEVRYFSGFRTLFWQSPTRPWHLILPSIGAPIAVIPEIGAELMRQTWVDDIRTWPSPRPKDEGVSLLVEALTSYKKVGMPTGKESSLRMPLHDFDRVIRDAWVDLADCSWLVKRLRMVKSPAEQAIIRRICAIGSRAFARAPELFSAGQPLSEAFRAFKIALLQEGAEDAPYLVGGAGQGGYGDVISPPTETPLAEGDVLMLDTGATLKGYFCDFDRNFAIGHADQAARAAHRTLWRATEAGLAVARPGARACDICAAMAAVTGGGSDVGRLGHGLGMQLTEWPSLAAIDETVMKPGMVMTLEPSITIGPGKMMVHEENILITEDAPELLTIRAPEELPVI